MRAYFHGNFPVRCPEAVPAAAPRAPVVPSRSSRLIGILWFNLIGVEAAVEEVAAALHEGGEIGGVGDEDEGDFFGGVQFEEQAGEGFGGGAVQCAGRFVGKEKLGLVDHGADDRDALAFAAGKLSRAMVVSRAQADAVEE